MRSEWGVNFTAFMCFCTFQIFHRDRLLRGKKTYVWETNSRWDRNLFWKVVFAFTSHFTLSLRGHLLCSRASNIITRRWLWHLCPWPTSLFWASELCASTQSPDNSVWWPIRTTASRLWLTCCPTFHPTIQIFCPTVLVNSTHNPIFQLCVSGWVRLDSCSIDTQSNTKANQFYLFNRQENRASSSPPASSVVSLACFQ